MSSDNNKTTLARRSTLRPSTQVQNLIANSPVMTATRTPKKKISSPALRKVSKVDVEEIEMEKAKKEEETHQLVEMIQKDYQQLAGRDSSNENKTSTWQKIYNTCKQQKHSWTKKNDFNALRRHKWPNIKRYAMLRYNRGLKTGKDVTTDVDKLVLSFVMDHEGTDNAAADNSAINDKEAAADQAHELRSNSFSPELSAAVGMKVGGGAGDEVKAAPSADVKPKARGSRKRTSKNPVQKKARSSNRSVGGNKQARILLPRSSRMAASTRAAIRSMLNQQPPSAVADDDNNSSSTPSWAVGTHTDASADGDVPMMTKANDDIVGGCGTMEVEELTELEQELLQAKMRLCEAKACMNEEEANVNRLEKRIWEGMLKKKSGTQMNV